MLYIGLKDLGWMSTGFWSLCGENMNSRKFLWRLPCWWHFGDPCCFLPTVPPLQRYIFEQNLVNAHTFFWPGVAITDSAQMVYLFTNACMLLQVSPQHAAYWKDLAEHGLPLKSRLWRDNKEKNFVKILILQCWSKVSELSHHNELFWTFVKRSCAISFKRLKNS